MCAIHINQLRIGSELLNVERMAPVHRERLEKYLSKQFSNQKEFGSFKIQVNPQDKAVRRVVQFYRNIGAVSKVKGANEERLSAQMIEAMRKDAVPGTNGQILAGMQITEDTLSLTRNILYAIPSVGPNDPVVNHLGYYAGIFWSFFAFRELNAGMTEYKHSQAIGDKEGRRRATVRMASGGIVSAASLIYLSGRIFDTLESATVSAASIGTASVLFGIGSMLAMGASILGAVRCTRFDARLHEYLEHPGISEVDRYKGALQFLKDSISVTAEERGWIENEVKHLPEEERGKAIEQKLRQLTETKIKYMKRRTSNRSLQLILTKTDRLLRLLSQEATQPEGIKESAILLHEIRKENQRKTALYILGFVAALISALGMIAGTFFTAGALPFVLYGISAMIYLLVGLYNAAGIVAKKEPEQKLDLHPIQDLGFH
jgi:hypothetical protein